MAEPVPQPDLKPAPEPDAAGKVAGKAAPTPDATVQAGSELRTNAGLWAVLGGLAVLALVAAFSIFRYSVATDAANVIAAVGTVLGALVGAFFGVHVGAAAGAQAQKDALNNAQATNQQAMDTVHQNTNKLVQAAVALQPGSPEANQFLAALK
ncbi:MAG TPA: hypothetical protein VGN81_31560 [Pseudonocardiaceae bacterium]|jgi:hypothetical protein